MIQLAPQETVLLVMRRHWYVFLGPALVLIVLFAVPSLLLAVGQSFFPLLATQPAAAIIRFLLALYLMAFLTYALILWIEYYLDVWIITNQRIIDIEQEGLFRRTISEISMERIQNITIEIPGLIATLLKFGNIKIETAGETGFTIADVPNCYRAKDLILEHSRAAARHRAA
ncbi:MAG: PH domain-containing protein [Candidatus Sungbacteria bacterium]|uniref:PH domain-containing protein n=1 Tax=Candidatus Sungiibacteriota bacterium TaxID=2750080 RepID=A0A932YW24_9BACT|nr:PH domain-containing protein [Candidatus Sungbacteria bacterium]